MISRILFPLFVAMLTLAPAGAMCPAQDDGPENPQNNSQDPGTIDERLTDAIQQWKNSVKQLSLAARNFTWCEQDDAGKWQDKWQAARISGEQAIETLTNVAVEKVDSTTFPDPSLMKFLADVQDFAFRHGRYQTTLRISEMLMQHNKDFGLLAYASRAAYSINEFDKAVEFFDVFQREAGKIPEQLVPFHKSAEFMQTVWPDELKIREQEAAADDLPRVEFDTTAGKVVVELFENNVPNTVALLISLIESGFYDSLDFFRVVEHQQAFAGCPRGDGTGQGDQFVEAENKLPENIRPHVRGTVTMVVNSKYQVGSQFGFILTPQPDLNGRLVPVGRVISGMDVLQRIARTHEMKAGEKGTTERQEIPGVIRDKINSIKVIRKRDHDYAPNTVTGDTNSSESTKGKN